MSLEYCCECDEPTGRAGKGDDSIYIEDPEDNEIGPLCEDCVKGYTFEAIAQLRRDLATALAERDAARGALRSVVVALEPLLDTIWDEYNGWGPFDTAQELHDALAKARVALEADDESTR